jgi:beta-lactamase regulating signal transducer with metallopeptidase domain
MGQASASAASTSAINSTGGNVNINQPNYVLWVIGGIIAILALFAWLKGKK